MAKLTEKQTWIFKTVRWIETVVMFAGLVIVLSNLSSLNVLQMSGIVITNVVMGVLTMLGYSVLMVACTVDQTEQDRSKVLFCLLIALGYIGVLTENMSWAVDGRAEYITLNHILSFSSFLVACFIVPVFWLYQDSILSEKPQKIHCRIVLALMLVDVIYLIIARATGYLYTIDAAGYYIPGNGTVLASIYPMLAEILCVVENLSHKMPLRQRIIFIAILLPSVPTFLGTVWENFAILYVGFFFDFMLFYIAVQMERNIQFLQQQKQLAEQSRKLTEQHTRIMLSQIQPHFLYNTLAAIYQLCGKDVTLARQVIRNFSSYLRVNMDSLNRSAPIPFEKELAHVKTYLEIELVRFAEVLKVEYDIACTDFVLPALTLQPLVENAVKYGARSRHEGGTVTISTHRDSGKVYVSVHDDGMGFDPTQLPEDGRSHVGIANTRDRLAAICDAELEINSVLGEGTTATIILKEEQPHESTAG